MNKVPKKPPSDLPLTSIHGNDISRHGTFTAVHSKYPVSPVGEGLVGLRYIDDSLSREDLTASKEEISLILGPGLQHDEQAALLQQDGNAPVIQHQPTTIDSSPTLVCTHPELRFLLEVGQIVVHLSNLRKNLVIDENATNRMEIIDETRKVLFHVEQDERDLDTDTSFRYHIYDKDKREIIQVYSPSSSTCICCGASWHSMKRCRFQAIVYTPAGVVAGFVRRSRTYFVQEFEILNANEEPLLLIRGGPQDLELYSLDLENELGRLSIHGWVGIMHEVRRSSGDYGMTFPIDLDVRVKSVLIGAIFAIHWLYSTKGGKKK